MKIEIFHSSAVHSGSLKCKSRQAKLSDRHAGKPVDERERNSLGFQLKKPSEFKIFDET